jgi:hypothetical protein
VVGSCRGLFQVISRDLDLGIEKIKLCGSWDRFPALPDFLRSSASGTGTTQPREDN